MELMRGVSVILSISRSSSRLSPRARHSSTSEDVVAVNKSDILHRTTKTEGGRPTCGVDEEEGQDENEKEKKDEKMDHLFLFFFILSVLLLVLFGRWVRESHSVAIRLSSDLPLL